MSPDGVRQFCSSFCASLHSPVPTDQVEEVLELVPEFKVCSGDRMRATQHLSPLHETSSTTLSSLCCSSPSPCAPSACWSWYAVRVRVFFFPLTLANPPQDDELAADEGESTSEASSDEMEGDSGESDSSDEESGGEVAPILPASESPVAPPTPEPRNKRMSTAMPAAAPGSVAASPAFARIRNRIRAGSVRTEGKLQYVSFVTKADVRDWFRQNGPNQDGAISALQARTFFELLSEVLRLKEWREDLDCALQGLTTVNFDTFVQLFLAVSQSSRECKWLCTLSTPCLTTMAQHASSKLTRS